MMQEKTDDNGNPLFDQDTFLDESQIKGIFGTLSKTLKKRKKEDVSLSLPKEPIVGIDYDDEDNGEEMQDFEDSNANAEVQDVAATIHKDALQIQNHLEENAMELDQCPITAAGVELCLIAEKLELGLDVNSELSKLSEEQKESIYLFLEKDQNEPPRKKRKTMQRMKSLILQHVKKNCNCCNHW